MIADAEREKSRRDQWLATARNKLRDTWGGRNGAALNSSLTQYWHRLRESQQTVSLLILSNVAVFITWQIPRLHPLLNRTFLHSTTSHPLTMLSSIFSHRTPMHLAFNMLALWSFGTILHDRLGREHFLAFYATAGLSASLGSHLAKLWRRDAASSLGASGALFGVFGACAHIPNVNVSIIFIPFHSFALEKALPFVMAFDAFGLWKGWRSFDHAAHLSGATAGYVLYPASTKYVWAHRRRILQAVGYPTI
jgi:rhomboid-like protein